jgi:hypothetical protein
MINRRQFVEGTAGSLAALAALRCGREPVLDEDLLLAVGLAVLPTELGMDGGTRIVGEFLEWAAEIRPGAELNHGYGTGDLRQTPDDPVPEWSDQLHALDATARTHGSDFSRLMVDERRRLIEEALAGVESPSMPNPLTASHIALALLGFFYHSPEATDLAYRAAIKKRTCRPLAESPRKPVSLDRGAGA